jgi:hypothetical protein
MLSRPGSPASFWDGRSGNLEDFLWAGSSFSPSGLVVQSEPVGFFSSGSVITSVPCVYRWTACVTISRHLKASGSHPVRSAVSRSSWPVHLFYAQCHGFKIPSGQRSQPVLACSLRRYPHSAVSASFLHFSGQVLCSLVLGSRVSSGFWAFLHSWWQLPGLCLEKNGSRIYLLSSSSPRPCFNHSGDSPPKVQAFTAHGRFSVPAGLWFPSLTLLAPQSTRGHRSCREPVWLPD